MSGSTAPAGADGGGERLLGFGVQSEMRQGSRLRAQERGADGFVLSSRQFRIGAVTDLDDAGPFLEALVIGASCELVGEIVAPTQQ